MQWKVTIHYPERGVETAVFDRPRDTWNAVREIVEVLEADGVVAGELERLQ